MKMHRRPRLALLVVLAISVCGALTSSASANYTGGTCGNPLQYEAAYSAARCGPIYHAALIQVASVSSAGQQTNSNVCVRGESSVGVAIAGYDWSCQNSVAAMSFPYPMSVIGAYLNNTAGAHYVSAQYYWYINDSGQPI